MQLRESKKQRMREVGIGLVVTASHTNLKREKRDIL